MRGRRMKYAMAAGHRRCCRSLPCERQLAADWRDSAVSCKGNIGEIAAALALVAQTYGGRNVADAIRRIIAGERDIEQLRGEINSHGYSSSSAAILAQLSGAAPAPAPAAQAQQNQDEPEGITLEQLFEYVAQACRPDAPAGLAARLHALTQQIATDASAPAEIRALGRALNAVLSGDRAPDLSALPTELADAMRALIAGIGTE